MPDGFRDPRQLSDAELAQEYRNVVEAVGHSNNSPSSYQEYLIGLYSSEISRRESARISKIILWVSVTGAILTAVGVVVAVSSLIFG